MGIGIAGLPTSRKTPGTYFNVILGGPGAASGAAPESLLLMGQRIDANQAQTVGANTYTIVAGTAAADTPELVSSEQDAIDKYGRGSELHAMAKVAIDVNPDVQLYAVAVAKAAGSVQASATLTLTGTAPTTDVTVRLRIDGRIVETIIASGTTLANTAIQIAQEVNNNADLPLMASVAAAVITFTSKGFGERFLRITVRVDLLVGTATTKLRTGALAGTVSGAIFTLSAATLATGGAGTETTTLSAALASVLAVRYNRIAIPYDIATPIGTVMTQVDSKAGVTSMLWEQVVCAVIADLTTATVGAQAISAGANNARLQLAWHFDSERLPSVIAASLACARLMGDGSLVGEAVRPQLNLDGLQLRTIPTQESAANYPTSTEVETALNYGVTPLVPSSSRPGTVQVARSITTKHKDATSALYYGVLDTTEVTVPDWVATDLRSQINNNFAGKNLDNDGDRPPKGQDVVTPNSVKGFMYSRLKEYELSGTIVEVEDNIDALVVERDALVRSRLNAEVPIVPPAGLHIFGANIRQLGGA